ncbi:MAG TPA: flagellar hook capping FlgD N-terminal domain-containing protein [Thermoleophilaceae bacterium]|nr:flagellar hook capping FlgD N-terminal domain-containing protein [Thermoleophilaceae bacterium]
MSVDPTSLSTPATAGTQTTNQSATLGKDDFLKLLTAQMSNMDPMSQSSSDPSQSMQQMTQFSILEQLTNLTTSQTALATNEKQDQAIALLGKTVDYTAADGSTASGAVQKVDFDSKGNIDLTIDGVTGISPAQIAGVS